MNIFLFLLVLVTMVSCGGSGGGGKKKSSSPVYKVEYLYPVNTLNPGQGSTDVYATAVVCKDASGAVVDDSLCGGFEDFDPLLAPTLPHLSPPGLMEVTLPNSEQGTVMVPVEEGVLWSNIDDAVRKNKLESLVTCSSGYVMNFKGDCVAQAFSYTYGVWPSNTLAACSGSQVFSRTYLCIDEVSGISVDYSFCVDFGVTPDINRTYLSQAGNGTMSGGSGDILNIHCQEGKTQLDVGNGTVISSVASCGTQRHLANPSDLSCTSNSYVATGIVYPTNNLAVGGGSRVVNSTSFTECRTGHDNQIVAMSYCSGISPTQFTQTQLSPAGEITSTTADGDVVTYTIAEGGTIASADTVAVASSCGSNRHLVGTLCAADTYTSSDFVFPANDLVVGGGSKSASATDFNICTRDHDSEIVTKTFCTMPAVAPTQTQLSPAGDLQVNVTGSEDGYVLVPVSEGEDWDAVTQEDKDTRISDVLVCLPNYTQNGAVCEINEYTVKILTAGRHACAISNLGNAKCFGQYAGTGTAINFSTSYAGIVDSQGDIYDSKLKHSSGSHYRIDFTPYAYTNNKWNVFGIIGNIETTVSGTTATCLDAMSSLTRCAGARTRTLSNVSSISFGPPMATPACGITSSNVVSCMTSTTGTYPLNGATNAQQVTLGMDHMCVKSTAGLVTCGGTNTYGQNNLAGRTVKYLSSADSYTCAIQTDNTVICVGRNNARQAGQTHGNIVNSTTPVRVSTLDTW